MATLLSTIIRRVRERLDDTSQALYTDATITSAVSDYLDDFISLRTGITYAITDDGTGTSIISPELSTGMPRLLSVGVALELLRREATTAARMAVSMDSPSGRVNLTERAKSLLQAVADLEDEFDDAESNVTTFMPTPKFVDTTDMETIRIETAATA